MENKGKGQTGLILAIVGGVTLIGVGLMLRKRNQMKRPQQLSNQNIDDSRILVDDTPSPTSEGKPSYAVLSDIQSPPLREYISSILDEEQAERLKGWLELIRQERSKDSSKWGVGKGFTSLNASDVNSALYQMHQQGMAYYTEEIKSKIQQLQ